VFNILLRVRRLYLEKLFPKFTFLALTVCYVLIFQTAMP